MRAQRSKEYDRLHTAVYQNAFLSQQHTARLENGSVSAYSSDRDVVENRGGVPRGVEMVVGCRERTRRRPVLVKEGGDIVTVGGDSRIIFRNGDVCDFHFFPCFRLVCLEDLVKRLFLAAPWSGCCSKKN